MSILESFFIQFSTNSSEAAADVKKLDGQIAALAAKGKARTDEETKELNELRKTRSAAMQDLKDQTKVVDDLGLSFSKMALAGVAAFAGLFTLGKLKNTILETIDYNAAVEKTSKLTGISARELAIWNGVVAKAGGDPNSRDFLNFIAGKNQEYAGLGINQRIKYITRDLVELSAKFQELGHDAAYALAQKLGIGNDLFLALEKGPAALQQMIDDQGKLNNLTNESAKNAFSLKQKWTDFSTALQTGLSQDIPAFHALFEIFKYLLMVLEKVGEAGNYVFGKVLNPLNWFGSSPPPTPPSAPNTGGINDPRGIRNNNPGNLRSWGGVPTNGGFAQFYTLQDGLDAEQKQLALYGQRGVNTLAGIGSKWAPHGENDTAAYIAGLSKTTGYAANQPLDLSDPQVRAIIANAINKQEEGAKYSNLIGTAQSSLAAADASPLNGIGSTGASKSMTIGSITINTQATDADGIASALHNSLQQHFATTIGAADDGQLY